MEEQALPAGAVDAEQPARKRRPRKKKPAKKNEPLVNTESAETGGIPEGSGLPTSSTTHNNRNNRRQRPTRGAPSSNMSYGYQHGGYPPDDSMNRPRPLMNDNRANRNDLQPLMGRRGGRGGGRGGRRMDDRGAPLDNTYERRGPTGFIYTGLTPDMYERGYRGRNIQRNNYDTTHNRGGYYGDRQRQYRPDRTHTSSRQSHERDDSTSSRPSLSSMMRDRPLTPQSSMDLTTGTFNVNAQEFIPQGGGSGAAPSGNSRRRKKTVEESGKTLRERLTEQLANNTYECLICCQAITKNQAVWTCKGCYHMFHISGQCITQWANKSVEGQGQAWKCPYCQAPYVDKPYSYYCFCGKERNPQYIHGETPHSCGEACGLLRGARCTHPCPDVCHPGPCSECPATVNRGCACGKKRQMMRCGDQTVLKCENVCDRLLSCGLHRCKAVCHAGACSGCQEKVQKKCYCGEKSQEVVCGSDDALFSCGAPCQGKYDCGEHRCEGKCHARASSACGPCPYSPARITNCPCGKERISDVTGEKRMKCTDPIPTCKATCGKILPCGNPAKPHRCRSLCHTGACPPCELNSSLACICGNTKKMVTCQEYLEETDGGREFRCERRCRRMKSCGVHKCQETCCTLKEHQCYQICNKLLSCRNHNCDHLCHPGPCPKCLEASFDEQFCLCGRTKRDPPIACGSALPECRYPCARRHDCGHQQSHSCHAEPKCPPCAVLVDRWCYGHHELRHNIPCYLHDVSCGRECGEMLKCGAHTCTRSCHSGPCEEGDAKCTKKCLTIRRGTCNHRCGLPCHGKEPCPPSDCEQSIQVNCGCGRRKGAMKCAEVERHYMRLRAVHEQQHREEQEKGVIPDVEGMLLKRSASMDKLNSLPCDDACAKAQRNKRIAAALELQTDDDGELDRAPTITYSDYLKTEIRNESSFCTEVEKTLVDLVRKADMHPLSHKVNVNLAPMKVEQRRFVHEYSAFFRVGSESVDSGAKRSVILVAKKGVSIIPNVLLTSFLKFPAAPAASIPTEEKGDPDKPVLKPIGSLPKVMRRRAPPRQYEEKKNPIEVQNAFAALCMDEMEEGTDHSHTPPKPDRISPTVDEFLNRPTPDDWWGDEEVQARD